MRPGDYAAEKARDIWIDERSFAESTDDLADEDVDDGEADGESIEVGQVV